MLKKNFLRLLMTLGLLGILTTGGTFVYQKYTVHQEAVTLEQLQKDVVLPTVRIKGEIPLPDGRVARIFGSGVIVYSRLNELGTGYDSYALTCNHVVELPEIGPDSSPFQLDIKGFKYGVKYLEFFDANSKSIRKVPARVIAHSSNIVAKVDEDGNLVFDRETLDPDTKQKCGDDVALLKIETPELLPVCKLPTKEALKVLKMFDKVRVMGAALADKPIPTFGEVTQVDPDFVRINAPCIFGNSGGPCFLEKTNELIGLVNMGRGTGSQFITHIGYIRPMYRTYNWLDTVGYRFIYDKSTPDTERFNKIRADKDEQLFKSLDEKAALQQKLQNLEAINQTLKEMVDHLKKTNELNQEMAEKIAELEKKVADLESQIAQLQKALRDMVDWVNKDEGAKKEESKTEPKPDLPKPDLEHRPNTPYDDDESQ